MGTERQRPLVSCIRETGRRSDCVEKNVDCRDGNYVEHRPPKSGRCYFTKVGTFYA